MMENKVISILGSGNVGRRIGEHFKNISTNIIFNDINKDVVAELNKSGYNATTDLDYTIRSSDISFIAVPTPLDNDHNNYYNLSYLENISKSTGYALSRKNRYHIFVLKSTVVPGTTEELVIPTIEKYSKKEEGKDFGVLYNPEFLTVISSTWTEDQKFCITPNNEERIVLGEGKNKKAGNFLCNIYKELDSSIPILRTDFKTAEMTKLVANNRLALAISFSNEIFLVCEELRRKNIYIDEDFIIDAVSRDTRIGKYGSIFKKAFGGPCFLKDTVALNTYLKNKTGNLPKLISDIININDEMKEKYGIRE